MIPDACTESVIQPCEYDEPTWYNPGGREHRCEIRAVREEDGGYSIYAPELPGVVSQGDTLKDAITNIAEALHVAISCYLDGNEPIPWERSHDEHSPEGFRSCLVVHV